MLTQSMLLDIILITVFDKNGLSNLIRHPRCSQRSLLGSGEAASFSEEQVLSCARVN
jgi:hypothetical protein